MLDISGLIQADSFVSCPLKAPQNIRGPIRLVGETTGHRRVPVSMGFSDFHFFHCARNRPVTSLGKSFVSYPSATQCPSAAFGRRRVPVHPGG